MKIGRLFTAAAIIFSLTLMTGCATLPAHEVMKSEAATFQLPKPPESGKAIVHMVRPTDLGGLIRFNVFADDKNTRSEMGYTRGSQYIYFNITPG